MMKLQNAKEYLLETFNVDEKNVKMLAEMASSYAVYRGLMKRIPELTYVPIQFTLTPSRFPEKYYNLIKEIQTDLNYVLHQVAHSYNFLSECFKNSKSIDVFTSQLLKVYEAVESEGFNQILQPVSLEISRCDYMLNTDEKGDITGIKQIENNTMACAMPSLSPHARELHELVLDHTGMKSLSSKIPPNHASSGVAEGMVAAWKLYGNRNAVILYIVEGHNMLNICDHRALEFDIWKTESDVKVLRHTFLELRSSTSLSNGKLFVNGKEVAIVYYRWGYSPHHYEPEDWDLRLLIERSKAIKCPTVAYHLAGTKRVQYELSQEGVLERFLPKGANANRIRQVFARQYLLSMDSEGDSAVALAISNPDKYVLKAEREGGGNNIFGEDIAHVLKSYGNSEARQAYILMEKINPPPCPSYTIQNNCPPKLMDIVMEIGIYGVLVGYAETLIQNREVGYVVKSKEFGANEGGLCAGYSFLDAPFLY